MERVEITRRYAGIASMQVCAVADATDEEIIEVCNSQSPSGTQNGWTEVVRTEGMSHQVQIPCEAHEDRIHFMVNC